ncbi:hypothetical protein GE09DRAFT_1218279 [Coniochaeta sp. 2T2.1]|nr:hypothetical protein GE09DRAFT_1218279 [Coniochaeta sp. 2T2.1]
MALDSHLYHIKAKSKASKTTNAQRQREESDSEEEEMASLQEDVRRKGQPAKRNAEDGKDKVGSRVAAEIAAAKTAIAEARATKENCKTGTWPRVSTWDQSDD